MRDVEVPLVDGVGPQGKSEEQVNGMATKEVEKEVPAKGKPNRILRYAEV